jgi:hypothetical protein
VIIVTIQLHIWTGGIGLDPALFVAKEIVTQFAYFRKPPTVNDPGLIFTCIHKKYLLDEQCDYNFNVLAALALCC